MLAFLLLGCSAPPEAHAEVEAGADRALANCRADQIVDIGMDRRADFHWIETYDGRGRKVRVDGDADLDGVIDVAMTYQYRPDGEELSHAWDGNNDGIADRVTMRVFAQVPPGARPRIAAEVTVDATGVSNVVHSTYGAHHEVLREDTDNHADGTIDAVRWNHYDERGNLVSFSGLSAGPGSPMGSRSWEYDERDLPVVERTDVNGDGKDEVVQITEYDALGRRSTSRWDTDGDGRSNNFTVWDYTCPGG